MARAIRKGLFISMLAAAAIWGGSVKWSSLFAPDPADLPPDPTISEVDQGKQAAKKSGGSFVYKQLENLEPAALVDPLPVQYDKNGKPIKPKYPELTVARYNADPDTFARLYQEEAQIYWQIGADNSAFEVLVLSSEITGFPLIENLYLASMESQMGKDLYHPKTKAHGINQPKPGAFNEFLTRYGWDLLVPMASLSPERGTAMLAVLKCMSIEDKDSNKSETKFDEFTYSKIYAETPAKDRLFMKRTLAETLEYMLDWAHPNPESLSPAEKSFDKVLRQLLGSLLTQRNMQSQLASYYKKVGKELPYYLEEYRLIHWQGRDGAVGITNGYLAENDPKMGDLPNTWPKSNTVKAALFKNNRIDEDEGVKSFVDKLRIRAFWLKNTFIHFLKTDKAKERIQGVLAMCRAVQIMNMKDGKVQPFVQAVKDYKEMMRRIKKPKPESKPKPEPKPEIQVKNPDPNPQKQAEKKLEGRPQKIAGNNSPHPS